MKTKTYLSILFLIILANSSYAQTPVLDAYIKQGVENNQALKQQEYDYEKSLLALKEARGYYYPQLSINARATVAAGGRKIEFPVGDLLNPVYSTLNTLTNSSNFPQLENQEIDFIRPFEHETKISLVQPLFNPQIYYNSKIQKELSASKSVNRTIYERNLIAEIQSAYMNVMKANKAVELINETRKLVDENVRVNESLYKNDKVTIDNIYRSKAELSKLDQQLAIAQKNLDISKKYFNFLLNRDLDEEIIIDTTLGEKIPDLPLVQETKSIASGRKEMEMISSYEKANELSTKMYKGDHLPTVALAADYGFQGSEYSFTDEDDFAMLSVVLKWDLFTGMRKKAKVQQAKIDRQILISRREEINKQLELQINTAYLDLIASQKAIEAAKEQRTAAEQAFHLINKKYKEGQANLLQYLDAQTTQTNAKENYWIEVYDYYMKLAEFEKQTETNIN